jgi:hypothetical protein
MNRTSFGLLLSLLACKNHRTLKAQVKTSLGSLKEPSTKYIKKEKLHIKEQPLNKSVSILNSHETVEEEPSLWFADNNMYHKMGYTHKPPHRSS